MAGELGQWAAEVRESDEGGVSLVVLLEVSVLEALELTTEHRNGSYPLRGGGGGRGGVIHAERGEGRRNRPTWHARDIVRMPRVACVPAGRWHAACVTCSGCGAVRVAS